MPKKIPWKLIFAGVGILVVVHVARLYAGAIARADVAAEQVDSLTAELVDIEADTARLTQALAVSDSARDARARLDSVRIAELAAETVVLAADFAALAAADSVHAEGVDAALAAMEARLDRDDLPALRHLTDAYETRLVGLSSQIVVQQELLEARDEEIALLSGELSAERESRLAADALLGGLRVQIVTQREIIDTQAIEIDELRSAVAPGFLTRLVQEAKIVGIAVAVTAIVVTVVQ